MAKTLCHARRAATAGCLMLFGALVVSPGSQAQQRVGVNSAVNPDAMGIPPGGLPRRLVLGQDIVFNERITTEATGQTQVLFVDESTLSIGPNANMVIDQFVYDPQAGTGKLAASLGRGVFRFVGGKISKQENAVTFHTPSATIGIRGGVVLVRVRSDCGAAAAGASGAPGCNALQVVFVYGNGVTITGLNGITQTLFRPGFEVTVSKPGAAPSEPGPAPPNAVTTMLAQLDGRAGSHGGAPTVPTEVMVANSGIARAISANVAASVQAAAQTQPLRPQPENVNPVVTQAQLNNQNVQVSAATGTSVEGGEQVSFNQFLANPTPSGTPIPTAATPVIPATPTPNMTPFIPTTPMTPPVTPPPVPISYAGNFKSTNGQGTARGLLDPGGTTSNGLAYSGGILSFPQGMPGSGVFTANLGSRGQLRIPLPPGNATLPANGAGTTSPAGPVTGSTYLSPDGTFFYANLTPVTAPTERAFISGGMPVNSSFYNATGSTRVFAFKVQPDAALQSNIPFIRNEVGGNLSNAVVSPYYVAAPADVAFGNNRKNADRTTTAQASLAINGQGARQQSVIVVQTGQFFTAADGNVGVTGVVRGSSRLDPTAPAIRITSSAANVIDGLSGRIYGKDSISGFVLDQNGYNFNCQYVPNNLAQENVLTSPSTITTSYAFNQPVTPTNVPAGVGSPDKRTTQTLTGFIGGFEQERTTANGVSPPPKVVFGTAAIETNAMTNRVAAHLAGGLFNPDTLPASGGANTSVQVQELNFGSTSGLYASRSAFIDNSHFAAVESPYNPAASTVRNQGMPPVIIDGQVLTFNGDPGQAGRLYLVSSGLVPASGVLPASYCQCQYLQWGYWGGDIRGGTVAENTLRERAHINTWVAGPQTPMMEINTLASHGAVGNYTGHLTGSVFNNGAQYVAAGGLQAMYNFDTQKGSFQVINYDGLNFTQAGKVPLAPGQTGQPNYAFRVDQPGLTGVVAGAFYGPKATETGGTFAFQKTAGPSYYTSGIFAAAGTVSVPPR